MTNPYDDIVALATPPGHAALAIIRISGVNAIKIVSRQFSKPDKLLRSTSHNILHGMFLNGNGAEVDEVLCSVFRQPHSYTGEDVVEISCHGNPQIANRILGILLKQARLAKPGEFTLRAYLNGRIDLSRAEAVGDLINARTALSSQAALDQMQGKLFHWLSPLMELISTLRMRFELAIDFSDQDLPPLDERAVDAEFELIIRQMQQALTEGSSGKFIREGIRICLTGAVNVGKSSLFNAFLQADRAIVTPHPGTTRDYLEETVSLRGYPAVIYDTAGIRDTEDDIESIGISHSRRIIDNADIILQVFDPDTMTALAKELEARAMERGGLTADQRTILVLNKCDLLGFSTPPDLDAWRNYIKTKGFISPIKDMADHAAAELPVIPTSSVLDQGINHLIEAILKHLSIPSDPKYSPLITNTRHISFIEHALAAVKNARLTHQDGLGYELVALDLMNAANYLGEIVGVVSTQDMLDRIFTNFCIGK
ncbi:MAG: tRNA uridine-5-carboxymethylaminomethyl(34) synthesis GTPase MnmE [Candidatus Cloacimonetes bacterium]|nr:tRNA uridine-5-carboxymethylaminomethyl(34) synthesis GTPase MnmE [Candidatus Cloacimonadota bacterium]